MRLKNITEILGNLIDGTLINTTKINDFSVGSTILSIYESVSMELEQYYVLTRENILSGIEEGVYEAFGFTRKAARKAYGDLTVEFHTALTGALYIPRGSSFHSTIIGYNQRYETLQDYYVPAGQSSAVLTVYCTESGTIGNVGPNIINGMINNLTNVKRVYNQYAIQTGQNEESIQAVKKRFQAYIDTRGRATLRALEYAARQVPDITGVYVNETTGYIRLYTHDLNGNLSPALQSDVKVAIEDYRPAGIKLDVLPVVKKYVDLGLEVTVPNVHRQTATFRNEILQTTTNYLNSFVASDDLVLAELIKTVMEIDDYEIYDIKITGLTENLVVAPEELIRAGSITVTFKGSELVE